MKLLHSLLFLLLFCAVFIPAWAQDPDPDAVLNFDETSEGPWSDIENTTLTIPKVPNGAIQLDGVVSSAEYGGFEAVEVIPSVNGWVLSFASEKNWESTDDSSFSFYLSYDDDFLYIGVDVKDDVIRSNDEPGRFWADDAIELVVDPLNTRWDYNTDSYDNLFGGHVYFNWEGKFSEWDEAAAAPLEGRTRWSSLVPWEYGEDKEVYGVGKESENGWMMEMRLHKVTMIDDQSDFKWQEGQDLAFNIGLDDDDGADLAIQYFWANRIRAIGANPDNPDWGIFTDEELANKAWLDPDLTVYDLAINANGRLSPAGAGEIILGPPGTTPVQEWSLF